MAIQVSKLFNSDWGVSITGYAAPVPELGIKKIFAYYAISYHNRPQEIKRIDAPKLKGLNAQLFYTNRVIERLACLTESFSPKKMETARDNPSALFNRLP
jgi:hypothetical protein